MDRPEHKYKTKIRGITYIVSNYYADSSDIFERIGNLIRNSTYEPDKKPVDVSNSFGYSAAVTTASGKEEK